MSGVFFHANHTGGSRIQRPKQAFMCFGGVTLEARPAGRAWDILITLNWLVTFKTLAYSFRFLQTAPVLTFIKCDRSCRTDFRSRDADLSFNVRS